MKKTLAIISSFALLPGCALIFDGKSQSISVNTNPPGANCQIVRNGAVIGSIASTPAETTIRKTKDDIRIDCAKQGYQTATFQDHSGVAGSTYADIIGGSLGLIGWGVDSATASDNKYDSPVNITLIPEQASAPMGAPAASGPIITRTVTPADPHVEQNYAPR